MLEDNKTILQKQLDKVGEALVWTMGAVSFLSSIVGIYNDNQPSGKKPKIENIKAAVKINTKSDSLLNKLER